MFQLPTCPYCNSIYRYNQVRKSKNEKEHKCYHCKKTFKVKMFPYVIVLWAILIIVTVLLNIAVLNIMSVFNIIPLLVISVIAVILGFCFIPFFMKYKKIEDKK